MNRIHILFFDNLKHIFNSYNSYYDKIERERKTKLAEIDNHIKLLQLRVN
jgi:hypothetical protein